MRKLHRSFAPAAEPVVHHDLLGSRGLGQFAHQVDLVLRVGGEPVDRHDTRQSIRLHDLHVRGQVLRAELHGVQVRLAELIERHAAVRLQRADGGHQHGGRWFEPAHPAHDVAELLEPEVGGEPGFGDDVVGQLQRDPVLDDRVVGVRDVAEGPGVDQHRLAFERLHQVRTDGILHQDRHRARDLEVLGGDRRAVMRLRHHHAAHPGAEVLQVGGEGEHRHDLRCSGDDELVLPRIAVCLAAQTNHRVPQLAIVHVERARPGDRLRIDVERIAVIDRGVQGRGQQVVRRGDGVEVAVQVEVDLLHGHNQGVATAGPATLDAEHGSHRRLAQAQHDVLADHAHALRQRDRGGRLSLAGLRGSDGRGDDQLPVGAVAQAIQHRQVDLPPVTTVGLHLVGEQASGLGHVLHRAQLRFLGDLERGLHGRPFCHVT